jgi:hypothetical protein
MLDIHMSEVSSDFAECWNAAERHLQHHAQGPLQSWLRAHLNPPFLEHLSFRLGNQLFFVRIEDVDRRLDVPGSRDGLFSVADGCNGHPCLMPMHRRSGAWSPERGGWGLIHARFGKAVDPPALITDERIEMTDWELQDFAIQVVRNDLGERQRQLIAWQSNPDVDPSIWFVGESGPEWIVVRAVRLPQTRAKMPANWSDIAESCARLGRIGHFASVGVASVDDPFDPTGELPAVPLWRGHAMFTNYAGLERQG